MGAEQVAHGWAGIDVGKGHHWVCLIDEAGSRLRIRRMQTPPDYREIESELADLGAAWATRSKPAHDESGGPGKPDKGGL